MRFRCISLACLLLAIALLATPALAQPEIQRGTWLAVIVRTAEGAAVPNAMVQARSENNIYNLQTNGEGRVQGQMPPGIYKVTVRGITQQVTVLKDAETPVLFTLPPRVLREVTQVVLGADGKPVPNAVVNASYCWEKKLVFAQATANADGLVTWQALPPVRVIVWGEKVPAGVLPADAKAIATPLPAPEVENGMSYSVNFTIANPGTQPMGFAWFTRIGRENYGSSNSGEIRYNPNAGEGNPDARAQPTAWSTYLQAGQLFNLMVASREDFPRISSVSRGYAPYLDDSTQPLECVVTLQEGMGIRGQLLGKDGKPVAGVSRLEVVPVKTGDLSQTQSGLIRNLGFLDPVLQPDGRFTVAVPSPGTYRLLIDMYDEGTTPAKDQLIEVPNGIVDATVKLPGALIMVPGGTEVNWMGLTSPGNTRRLSAASLVSPMPVYGPGEQLMAVWYKPTPDKMVVHDAISRQKREFRLRTVDVVLKAENATPYGMNATLLPPLPLALRDRNRGDMRQADNVAVTLTRPRTRLNLWTTPYLVQAGGMQLLEVPETGGNELICQLGKRVGVVDQINNYRVVRLKFPQADYQAIRQATQAQPIVSTDGNANRRESIWITELMASISVPVSATKLSVNWQGHGFIKDVPLPPAVNPAGETPQITLPDWVPGASVNGQLLQVDGKPIPNTNLYLSILGGNTQRSNLQTDAEGKFTLKGIPAGTYFLTYSNGSKSGGWLLQVPDAGLPDLTLRLEDNPIRLNANTLFIANGGVNMSDQGMYWWIPAGGKPIAVPRYIYSGELVWNNMPLGPGELWVVDGNQGTAGYLRFTPTPGQNINQPLPAPAALGMYFPLDLEAGMPTAVTLVGEGPRVGLTATFPTFYWQASSMLKAVVGQVTAVPPGPYKVIVETSRGPVEKAVTVTEYGAYLTFEYPPAPPKPAEPAKPAGEIIN